MEERRSTSRHQISVPITGWLRESQMFEGRTRDISSSGAYIETNRPATVGDLLVFLMRLPASYPEQRETLLWAYCRAVRVEAASADSGFVTGVAAVALEYSLNLRDSSIARVLAQNAA